MSTSTLVVLSVILALVVIGVLALALIEVQRRLASISGNLATLAGALFSMISFTERIASSRPVVVCRNATIVATR